MTSFIIDSHKTRKVSSDWKPANPPFCAFCRIIRENAPAHKVYENEDVVAILDILPIRPGHVLVIPKVHISRLSELPPEIASATGEAVSRIADALTKAMGNTALNVVCNQEYAQAVPHVHFHIVPAPTITAPPRPALSIPSNAEMHRREFQAREELDDTDAERISQKIRSKL